MPLNCLFTFVRRDSNRAVRSTSGAFFFQATTSIIVAWIHQTCRARALEVQRLIFKGNPVKAGEINLDLSRHEQPWL